MKSFYFILVCVNSRNKPQVYSIGTFEKPHLTLQNKKGTTWIRRGRLEKNSGVKQPRAAKQGFRTAGSDVEPLSTWKQHIQYKYFLVLKKVFMEMVF